MITAEQCEKASDLLIERAELIEPLEAMRATAKVRIAYQVKAKTGESGKDEPRFYWRDGPEVEINASLRKLLVGGIETELASIDAKLRALGVEPPSKGEAA